MLKFDGAVLDCGTVVEFLYAKTADMPAVLLRTDVRNGGDYRDEPWNLMASYFPRTQSVFMPSLDDYRARLRKRRRGLDHALHLAGQHSSAVAQLACDHTAALCVRALERVLAAEPVMPKHLREAVYQWLALMPDLRGKEKALRHEFEGHLERKVERDLL
jgi:hypothetical protein